MTLKQNLDNALPIGTVLAGELNRYKIIDVLGHGAFGITYLASVLRHDESGTCGAVVAIKEFFMAEINGRSDLTVTASNKLGLFDKYRKKFIKETKNLGKLEHKNIVKVLESFAANNTVYYSMEYIEGGSLDEYISRKGHLTENECENISYEILDALRYMHSEKMLHLDLKPSNIMMRNGMPVLIDFGLSKQYDDDGNPESSTTVGAGTPGYAPIEQSNYDGELSAPNHFPITMDIYALGATMFKMLTGKKPPISSDILNNGFPKQELQSKNISQEMQTVVKAFMEPLWKNRPQSDAIAISMLEKTEMTGINVDSDKSHSGIRKSWVISGLVALVLIGFVIVALVFSSGSGSGNQSMCDRDLNGDSAYSCDSVAEAPMPTNLPDIKYSVKRSGFLDENAQLCANINGEEVVIGSLNYVFGSNNNANMKIFAQDDFNGDGIMDALVYDPNPGNAGGATWTFISYAGGNSFEKSNLFEASSPYYGTRISTVDGQKVLDFMSVDLGQEIVKERYGLRNGNAVSLSLPKSKTVAYSTLKSINMSNLGDDGHFYFDLNDDGIDEEIVTTGSFHLGRNFSFNMQGQDYEFCIDSDWGAGTLHILKSKTKGLYDLMVESPDRSVYKWDGTTYVTQ